MYIDDDNYMLLLRRSIEKVLVPELQSEEAKRVGHIVLGGLDELLRRQWTLPHILTMRLPEGVGLARSLIENTSNLLGLDNVSDVTGKLDGFENSLQGKIPTRKDYQRLLGIIEEIYFHLGLAGESASAGKHDVLPCTLEKIAEWENRISEENLVPLEYPESPASYGALTATQLAEFMNSVSEKPVQLGKLERIPGGMSKHTYRFTIEHEDGRTEELIARKIADNPLVNAGAFVLKPEFDLVRDIYNSGYLIPEPLFFREDPTREVGEFYVMRRIAGKTSGSVFTTDSPIDEVVLLEMARQLALLHSIDIRKFENYITRHEDPRVLEMSVEEAVEYWIDSCFREWKKTSRQPSPIEMYYFAWLKNNIPSNRNKAVLVHGDFTPHNCMWEGSRVTGVIDWEAAHFGDPAEDLAYIRPHIKGRMSWSRFLRHYEEHSGREIREEDLDFYDCFAYVRPTFMANIMSTRVQNKESEDVTRLHVDDEYHRRFMNLAFNLIRTVENRKKGSSK